MEAAYGEVYRQLYERHWWWRARERLILAELDRLRPAGGRWDGILDVGCGDGLLFPQLALRSDVVEGVELEADLLGPDADPRIHRAPFDAGFDPGRRYELVLMLDVLEHLDDPRAAVARAAALLRPGGILFVTVPAFPALFTQHDVLNHHRTRYTRRTLRALLDPGLELLEQRYFFHWLFPLKLAVRVREALLGSTPTLPAVPPAPLNAALRRLSELEQGLLRRARLPLGSSLLTIARKRG